MKPIRIAAAALAIGALAVAGAAQAHPKKHKHHRHHYRPVAERVVVKRVYVVGERLPDRYYSNNYYYVQPSRYQLPPAPYGYRYVRAGNGVYLAQTETGLITQVVTSLIR